VAQVLYALLFLPAILASVFVLMLVRRPVRVLDEIALPPPTISGDVDPVVTLDTLLAELEAATLDERAAIELERLADLLEAAAASLERVG
jgi:hypothetical protein